jgi:tRNA (pseudouridine54-N1)-methyltransferase
MREFVYFSQSARTSGNFDKDDLMKAGRMDIAIHSFIQGVFLSHGFRKDMKFHFIFYGMPDPPKHIEIQVKDDLEISKKDVGNLIRKILYKYKEGKKTEVFPGCFVEKKSFLKLIEEMKKDGKEIYLLDKRGEDLRKMKINNDCVFILGDHEGLPKKESKRLREMSNLVSIGNKMYFASQTVAVVNNELDYRGI